MTPTQQWLSNQSKDFKDGYEAYCLCEVFDKLKSAEWQKGWLYAAEQIED
jgi:hypothetical protein